MPTQQENEAEVSKMLFRHQMLTPPNDEELQKGIEQSLNFGMGTYAPHLRDPTKRWLSGKIRELAADPSQYEGWKRQIQREVMPEWVRAIKEEGGLGPYVLKVFRGGRNPTVPGRGTFHTPDPEAAGWFTGKRGVSPNSDKEMIEQLKRVDATEKTISRPYIHRPASAGDFEYTMWDELADMSHKLKLNEKEQSVAQKLLEDIWIPDPRNVVPGAKGAMPNERKLMKFERYMSRKAKERGYDAVIRFDEGENWIEMIDLADVP